MELTTSFMALLDGFQHAFTAPSFATFRLLMTGWILSHRHRYVTDLIVSSDSTGNGHFSGYHRFFSEARWNIDHLWKQLAVTLVCRLIGPDATILLAGDDTLCNKRGLKLFGAGMHHDPLISSKAMKLVSWGHDWVTLCLLIVHPWWAPTKVFALPICMRLYKNRQGVTKGKAKKSTAKKGTAKKGAAKKGAAKKSKAKQGAAATGKAARKSQPGSGRKKASPRQNKAETPGKTAHRTRPELMLEMLQLAASWFPDRRFLFVGDSLYAGQSVLSHLPENVDMVGQVFPTGAMYEPAPPYPGCGRRRKKGERQSTRDEWASDGSRWKRLKFDQYGLHTTLETKTRNGLYYKAGKDRLLKFALTRDAAGKRPTQIFYCTDLTMSVREVLSHYSRRWSIEVTHYDTKQHLGLEDPANRTQLAVQRTAPMAMFLYSLTVLWYAEHGHDHLQFPERPWYTRKSEPSFADMLTTLRRLSWEDYLSPVRKTSGVVKNAR